LAGFKARKQKGVGHFVTRERLDAFSSARLVDVLREIPGVKMRMMRGGVSTVTLRGSCVPLVFIDGFPAIAGAMDLDMIDLAGVEGIEVYSGVSTVPAEFTSVRGLDTCGVIAIWSRPFRSRQRRQAPIGLADLERLIVERKVYTADQVDKPAILVQDGGTPPAYPDSLWHASASGGAIAEFVVGTDGFIEAGTLRIVSATHPHFASAVRSSLEGAMFRAADLGGRAVRQMVHLPFRFERKDAAGGPGPGASP
jgi:hypothetical protein